MNRIKSSSGHRAVAVTDVAQSANANAEVVTAQIPLSPSELLASAIVTTAADESFAIEYSILTKSTTRSIERHSMLTYWLLWPIMILIAALYAATMVVYRALSLVGLVKGPVHETGDAKRTRILLGPKALTWAFLWNALGDKVRHGVTTSEALDVIYAVPCLLKEPASVSDRVMRFWLNQPDGQAVRNRLRITYQEASSELRRLIVLGQKEIRFLVLACGSAQASIEAAAHTQAVHPEVDIRLTLVDLNLSSLRRALRLAEARGIADRVRLVEANLNDFLAEEQQGWDMIEMVGFLDYRNSASFHRTCGMIRGALKKGGLFIAAGICPNPWSFVVRWVINWPYLIRRRPRQIQSMLARSGFMNRVPRYEPHNIHHVVLCRT